MSDRDPNLPPDRDGGEPIDPIDPQMAEPDLGPLAALLGDPEVWDEPDPDLEDSVLAAVRSAIVAEGSAGTAVVTEDEASPARPLDLVPRPEHRGMDDREEPAGEPLERPEPVPEAVPDVVPIERARRRWVGPLLGAAAALVLVAAVGLASLTLRGDDDPDLEVALVGTDLAPDATAVAEVTGTPMGTRLVLDVTGLPPAPDGQYYEAWLRQSPEIGVSAGTFHLRGGDGAIELWSGVTVDRYPLITVTIQDEDAGAMSSGRVVLKGTVSEAEG